MPAPPQTTATETKDLKALLDRELLGSLRLRATVVAAVLGVASVVMTLALLLSPGVSQIPIHVPLAITALTLYELGMRQFISRAIADDTSIQRSVWYLNAIVEITSIVAVMWAVRHEFANPLVTLLVPAYPALFVFIVLSTLHLDLRMGLFTGGLAALEYTVVVIAAFQIEGASDSMGPLFASPPPYAMRVLILLAAGVAAGMVARELERRMNASFEAMAERDRVRQADALKSRFLADVSHEIRTPLNAILGFSQLLGAAPGLSADSQHAIRTISASGSHLLNVINGVLDLSRIEAGREELRTRDFAIGRLTGRLSDLFASQCESMGLRWRVDVDTPDDGVHGDETKLQQVLTNLIGNAVRVTNDGFVHLEVRHLPGDHYLFSVRDTGPGIPPETVEQLFEPYAQGQPDKDGAAGLGLAIAQRQVRLMGGLLQVESDAEGTRFWFSIPLARQGIAPTQDPFAPVGRRLAAGTNLKALVVDDLEDNRDVLQQMLERIGAQVEAAGGGMDALDLLTDTTFDIVFLDIRMPDLSGPETLDQIRSSFRHRGETLPPVVAVSASALLHERQRYLDAGFDDFIDKPVRMARLYSCIEEQLGINWAPGEEPAQPDAADTRAALPADLRREMLDAARVHNVTVLRRGLGTLEDSEPASEVRQLALVLRAALAEYDMDAITEALRETRSL